MSTRKWRQRSLGIGKQLARPEQSTFDPMSTFKVPTVEREVAAPGGGPGPHRADDAASVDRTDLLVIGNGIAGCIAAMETRQYAPDARILVVTEQNYPTINTPALKQFGAGRIELEQLMAYSPGTEQQLGIGIIHQRATKLDPSGHRVHLADGRAITYRSLLLATGARSSPPPADLPGHDFDGVLRLHTLSDYLDLRRRIASASSAVVIGGGYHAAETAMLLRHQRLKVTWLIRGRSLLPSQLDSAASDLLLRQARRHGIDVRLESEAAGIVGRMGVVAGVVTTDNAFIPCELVITAIGTRPDIELAQGTPIMAQPGAGIRVNERMQTTARDVYAAGAAAAVLDPQLGEYGARGQWFFAVQQGRLAAAAMTGVPLSEEGARGAVGAFWHSTQFDKLSILAAGAPMLSEREHPHNEVLTNGSGSFYRRIVMRHGHLVGYLAVGPSRAGGMGIKRLIDERIDIEEIKRKLLTEDFDLRSFFTQRRLHALSTGEVASVPRSIEQMTEQIIIPWRFESAGG